MSSLALGVYLNPPASAGIRSEGQSPSIIQQISLIPGDGAELQISLSQLVKPQTMVLSGPDRLVIDFPNALAGPQLHKSAIGNEQVKAVRVGLFKTNPPVTRVVVDLRGHQWYEIRPLGNLLLVKIGSPPRQGGVNPTVNLSATPKQAKLVRTTNALSQPTLRFSVLSDGALLSIHADNGNLAEILFEVHRKTGAEIPIPSGAEQEHVSVNLGPGPARDVLSSLLNGTRFNFVMVGSESDPGKLQSVILTPKFDDGAKATSALPATAFVTESPQPEPVQVVSEPDPPTMEPQPDVNPPPDGTPPPSEPPPSD